MSSINFLKSIILTFLIFNCIGEICAVYNGIQIPSSFKSEGQIILCENEGDQLIQHHLVFTEVVDTQKLQAHVSIGQVSHIPTNYYKRQDSPVIKTIEQGDSFTCEAILDEHFLIPELSWFSNLMFPGQSRDLFSSSEEYIGPIGLLEKIIKLSDNYHPSQVVEEQYNATHRYVDCQVMSREFVLKSAGVKFHLEIFHPIDHIRNNNYDNYFSVRATTTSLNNKSSSNFSFTLDYLDFQSMDKIMKDKESFESQFHLPLGCSKYLSTETRPKLDEKSSFTIEYEQQTLSIQLIYDSTSAILQKEVIGEQTSSTNTWLLDKNSLININTNIIFSPTINGPSLTSSNWTPCSLLSIDNQQVSSSYQPKKRRDDKGLNILEFLGISEVVYMGSGTVRHLPCRIYESIIPEPPAIFATSSVKYQSNQDLEFIIQLYLLEGEDSTIATSNFKPLRMVLFSRSKSLNIIQQVDELDIYKFSLSSNDIQISYVSECFGSHSIASDEVQLEVMTKFNRLNLPNSYLENWLLNNILDLLSTNRLHLTDYEFKLTTGNNLDISMTLADWNENIRRFNKVATGKLSYDWLTKEYDEFMLRRASDNEETCLLTGSHLSTISSSLVLYCEDEESEPPKSLESVCLAIAGDFLHKEAEVMQRLTEAQESAEGISCAAYKFKLEPNLIKSMGSISSVIESKNLLLNHKFNYIEKSNEEVDLTFTVQNYNLNHVTKLEIIDNYAFVERLNNTNKVHKLESTLAENLEDCVRICNLDVTCRSYSFCSGDNDGFLDNECIISSLDIEESRVQNQLNRKIISQVEPIEVKGVDSEYSLIYSKRCKIYERNYLDTFREVDETIQLKRQVVNQYPKITTVFECAKSSLNLEMKSATKQVTKFAYCASEDICIIDDNILFGLNYNTSKLVYNETNEPTINNEVVCRVYRKQYQSFYHVSARVLKKLQDEEENGKRQVELNGVSVEECARVCWSKFGEVCSSFDYCQPGSCLINQVEIGSDSETEIRSNCLHYDRDLKLDQLRETAYERQLYLFETTKSNGFIFSVFTYFVAVTGVLVGFTSASRLYSHLPNKCATIGLGTNHRTVNNRYSANRSENISNLIYELKDMETSVPNS